MNPAVPAMVMLLVGSAVFSGSEAALFTLASRRRDQIPALARNLLHDPAGVLIVILLGNLIINLGYFSMSAAWAAGVSARDSALIAGGSVLGLILFGEILPKVIAHRYPTSSGRVLLPPVWALHLALRPLATWMGKRLAHAPRQPDPLDPEAADDLLEEHGHDVLEEDERRLVRQVLELGTLRAGAVRRPLSETLLLPAATPLAEARRLLHARGLAWCAVTDAAGVIRGVLDLTRWPEGDTVRDVMIPVPIQPEVGAVSQGVELLRKSGAPFVLLVDEYGEPAGIIERGRWADTLLDRLPEQPAGKLPAIVPLGQGRFQVDAGLPLHVFRERFGDPGEVDVRVDTLGGLVQERLGRMPRPGDTLRLGGYQSGVDVRVVRCQGAVAAELEVRSVSANDGTPGTHPRAGSE